MKGTECLKEINLIGTGIGKDLTELLSSFRQDSTRSINLELNGITHDYFKIHFKHMVNFENLQELNISNNWIDLYDLYDVKNEFLKFKNLHTLKMSNCK